MDAGCATETAILNEATSPPLLAVIAADPGAPATTRPDALGETTDESDELQMIDAERTATFPVASSPRATKCAESATSKEDGAPSILMLVGVVLFGLLGPVGPASLCVQDSVTIAHTMRARRDGRELKPTDEMRRQSARRPRAAR